ncbi:DUF5994 family protein [Mycobacterium arosiense]|uniref:DUF5994 family protein n=1 Tax=Mycobacterium arosiense TaxID=425468 RepID=UPI0034D22866
MRFLHRPDLRADRFKCEGSWHESPRSMLERTVNPLRLTLPSRLGNKLDGAWWPRTGVVSRGLPDLVLNRPGESGDLLV